MRHLATVIARMRNARLQMYNVVRLIWMEFPDFEVQTGRARPPQRNQAIAHRDSDKDHRGR
jgi:hypothetical protein